MAFTKINEIMDLVRKRDPDQLVFHQAVEEVLSSISDFLEDNPKYLTEGLLERIIEPERVIIFRVPWEDDSNTTQVNRGFRVQMSSVLGPYKGGLRFHPSVNLEILKSLAFEQVFKNSLTTLPMGGAKGGSDFNPKGKSDSEIMRFCQSFMTELYRHIGANIDVPAGDIGVGSREIGYLYGQYKRLTNEVASVLTGKTLNLGGSLIRPEATGYGLIYFVQDMLATQNRKIEGLKVSISGSGNVSQYAAKKLIDIGAKVVTLSDSGGYVLFDKGMSTDDWLHLIEIKGKRRERIETYAHERNLPFFENQKPWNVPVDIALPCATQNEILLEDAKMLVQNGCFCVAEGSNIGSMLDAVNFFIESKILYAPSKAANAGGVTVSGLEMTQNSIRLSWNYEKVDRRLSQIMHSIHAECIHNGKEGDYINYVKGANITGFKKVADAMLEQGVV